MEEEARRRKDRLEAIRKRKQASNSSNNRLDEDSVKDLTFRSYTPTDETLKKHVNLATPTQIKTTAETETKDIPKETLQEAAEKEKEEVDLFNLAPKKANWDLRRDVEKKLERLDKRTQRAILETIRQRLTNEGGGDLAEAVANAEAQQKLDAQIENE
ncbi:mRNA splicing factor [Chlamydoabsidia padenii]|nr:mRNA splicing factor [Chlamydoabsidia padenii]